MAEQESRVKKSLLNARVNVIFYVLVLGVTFFSRKIFLDILGTEFVGLTSTLSNLLGMLNIAEMGVGSAVGYMLYKPIFEKDHTQINEIISVFGFIYRRIGQVLIAVAGILSCFLPMIFDDTSISLPLIYFVYFSFLTSSLLSYFVNYKQTLLGADQKQYVVTGFLQSANILRLLLQMYIVTKTRNLYYWVAMEIVFSIIYSAILNWRIRKTYPWLKSSIKDGKRLFKQYKSIVTYTKQLFVHRIGGVVLTNLSPLIVYAYTSLTIVALYTNYTIIIDKVVQLISQFLSSSNAGVGHLVAQGDKTKIKKVYWELIALYYAIAGVTVVSIYFLIDPFITLWLGAQFILPHITLVLLLINLFIQITRLANEYFLYAHGLFYDMWAPITEAAINITMSILLGTLFGLNGVLMGTTISLLTIVVIWKPIFLFTKGFKISIWIYVRVVMTNLIIIAGTLFLMSFLLPLFSVDPKAGFFEWGLYALIVASISALVIVTTMYIFTQGMRDILNRFWTMIKPKIIRR